MIHKGSSATFRRCLFRKNVQNNEQFFQQLIGSKYFQSAYRVTNRIIEGIEH